MPPMDEAAIHAILSRVILSGRLPGRTKLGEVRLAELFGVSRERIRKVLHRLGHERLIDVVKNRGAFTVAPDLSEIHVVFEARRILEGGIAAHLAERLTDAGMLRLREHVEREAEALRSGDRATWLKLSAEFHVLLAELTENPIIVQQARELVGRTTMLATFFESSSGSQCGCDEHRAVFRALAAGERGRAVRAMSSHLAQVETRLKPFACTDAGPDLDSLIAEYAAELGGEVSVG